jgi:hypothetical protein
VILRALQNYLPVSSAPESFRLADDDGHPQSFAKFGGLWFVLRQGDGPSVRNGDHISLDVSRTN